MRLYMIAQSESMTPIFYWAQNEEDALDQYQAEYGEEPCRADMVWANNKDSRYKGYVINDNQN